MNNLKINKTYYLNKIITRILEILPALLAWLTILLPVIFSFKYPYAVATFIVIFSALWFVRAMEFASLLIYSFIKFKKAEKVDWKMLLENFNKGIDLKNDQQILRKKLIDTNTFIKSDEVIHWVVIPTYKEEIEVLRQTVNYVAQADFDSKKIIVCIATEERDHKRGSDNAKILLEEFKDVFMGIYHFEHPDGIEGEVKGKGGNITHAGREMLKIFQKENIDLSRILATTLDADNCVHKDYFLALTHAFCINKNRKHISFQPLPFYFNNIWDVPILNRVVSLSSSFWHMIENGRPDRLRNFASHAQPFEALAEMDFWATDTIVEDGHQFWRSYLHFRGKYSVTPVFVPIYFDAFQDKNYFRSIKGQFLQLRRWAWGVTDIPFMVKNWFRLRKELPFFRTTLQFWRLFEGHFMWATAPVLITLTTPVPRMISSEFRNTVFAANSAFLISNFFRFAFVGIIVAMTVSLLTMPKPKKLWQKISILFQWFLLPIVTVIFGSLSALSAQTILAIGKKLEFNVTPKIRIDNFDEEENVA